MAAFTSKDIENLFQRQFEVWETAKNNFEALKGVKVKALKVGNATFNVQFNPGRIVSSAAKVDAKSLAERKCFLCAANRPAVQEGLAWENYTVLINPFPIFPRHLTIPCNDHTDQLISGRIGDMMSIAALLPEYILFYNGPKCGASAPDHMHFQAGNKGFMTFDTDLAKGETTLVKEVEGGKVEYVKGLGRVAFVVTASKKEAGEALFNELFAALPQKAEETEAMLNVLCWVEGDEWKIGVFPRKQHRPSCYSAEGDANILISPASVDMGGVFITPLEKDFEKITAEDVQMILDEVCFSEADAEQLITTLKG